MNYIKHLTVILIVIICGCQSEKYYVGHDGDSACYCLGKTHVYKYELEDGSHEIELGCMEIYKGEKVENSFPIEEYIKARFPHIFAFYNPPLKEKGKSYIEQYSRDWLTCIIECTPAKFKDLLAGKKYKSYADIYNSNTAIMMSGSGEAIQDASKEANTLLTHLENIAYHDEELAINTHKKLHQEAIEIRKFSFIEHIPRKEKTSNKIDSLDAHSSHK